MFFWGDGFVFYLVVGYVVVMIAELGVGLLGEGEERNVVGGKTGLCLFLIVKLLRIG